MSPAAYNDAYDLNNTTSPGDWSGFAAGLSARPNRFVYSPDSECSEFWSSWPSTQEDALADGKVLIFELIPAIGNFFLVIRLLLPLVQILQVGLVLTWTRFPGFREAFDPAEIKWDVDAAPFMRRISDIKNGIDAVGVHALTFKDGAMVLSDSQLDTLAMTIGAAENSTEASEAVRKKELPKKMRDLLSTNVLHLFRQRNIMPDPCTWNMLLSRSPSMMAALEEHNPWGFAPEASGSHPQHPADYVAWHIRTGDGETTRSYKPEVHKYIFQEPSSTVCPAYFTATQDVVQTIKSCPDIYARHKDGSTDDMRVYISSTSKSMTANCTADADLHNIQAGYVDLGLHPTDMHTQFSSNPKVAALNSFLDYLFMMDATAVVRTGSSFSGTVVEIKGLHCQTAFYSQLPHRKMFLCLPATC